MAVSVMATPPSRIFRLLHPRATARVSGAIAPMRDQLAAANGTGAGDGAGKDRVSAAWVAETLRAGMMPKNFSASAAVFKSR